MRRFNRTLSTCVLGSALLGCGTGAPEERVGTTSQALTDLFSDNFSTPLTQWNETGEGDFNTESLHASTGYPGTGSGTPAAHFDDCDTECTITSPAIDLSGATSASLAFLRFVDSEFDTADYARVELFDGTSWVRVRDWFGGSGDTNSWVSENIDLAPYLGRTDFRVRFVGKSDGTSEHFQVDDIKIRGELDIGSGERFFDAFAAPLTQWTESGEGDWNTESLHASTGYPVSASGAPAAHADDCDTECTITSPVIDLSGGTNASLSFLRFVDSEFDAADYARVELYNGSSWVRVRDWFGGSGDTNSWVSEYVDLSPYLAVSGFRVRFVLKASDSNEHFHVDDVRVLVSGGTAGEFSYSDVGTTGASGSTTTSGGSYTMQGSGGDIWDTADAFQFAYKALAGDGQITARIQSVTETDPWTKVGVMIRDSLAPGAKNAFMLLRPSAGSAFQWRDVTGGGTNTSWNDAPTVGWEEHRVRYLKPAKWLRMTRQGNAFSVYTSDDGQCWYFRWKQTIAFDDNHAYFGVALNSHDYGALATATVTNLSVQSTIDPLNGTCDRSAVDGDLPVPTSWVFPPGRFGTSTWNITTTNPSGTITPIKCDSGQPDENEPAPRRDGPDHPNCPVPGVTPAWTTLGFTHDTPGWQLNRPGAFGFATYAEGDTLATQLNSRAVWLRKTFTLASQAEKNEVVLWGRWAEGISVYVNGVLATSNPFSTGEYRYLGLSNEARAALAVGNNVIAIRLEWDRYEYGPSGQVVQADAWQRFFDLGLARESRLASLPVDRMTEPKPAYGAYVDAFREIMQEQGVSGATLAVNKNGQTLVSAGFGWANKNLTTPLMRDAVLRLASNDKIVTQAAVVKLIREGRITPSTPVFPLLGLSPIPGFSPGANVNQITVEHLRTHTSGIGHTDHSQAALDEIAFRFGISTAQWNKHYYARWLYSVDATDVGGAGRYSSNGYFLLRYLVEHLVAPKTLDQYLAQDMGLTDIVVSRERLASRHAREPGYVTREPTWDRWMALEDFLALSASASGYASFFQNYEMGYDLQPNDAYTPSGGGVMGGGMAGTWSIAVEDAARGLSLVMITSNHGHFDEALRRVDQVTFSDPCLFGPGDPRPIPGRHQYIQNVAQSSHYIHHEHGALESSPAQATWWSSQWLVESVDGTYFRIRNRWMDTTYLNVQSGSLALSEIAPSSTAGHWELVSVGDGFLIRNRSQGTYYLNTQGGSLTAGPVQTSSTSAQWRFCN
jgi:CubicO group peptidase (beta-lactamase class C family)